MKAIADRRSFLVLGAGACAAAVLGGPIAAKGREEDTAAAPEMSLFEAVRTRRSVRRFRPDPVPKEHIERIVQAARLAPTSGNQQPWKFLVVRERARIEELKENCIAYGLERFRAQGDRTPEEIEARRERAVQYYTDYLSAPVYIVVLTSRNSRYADYNHWDGPLAAGTLMLAARALGYGTVFCTDSIPDEVTRSTFAIPDHYERVCITPVGVPAEWPDRPPKRHWRTFVQYETF